MVIIPAKALSLSLPNKNLRPVNGHPLLSYPILAAKLSSFVDQVIVSTEDTAIKNIALSYGAEVPFTRPKKLAEAHATSGDVLINAEQEMKDLGVTWDYSIFMQCTTPFVTAEDIDACIKAHWSYQPDTTLSVTESPIHPEWVFHGAPFTKLVFSLSPYDSKALDEDRQFLKKYYVPNGAIYINKYGAGHIYGKKLVGYLMPRERSIDIDDELDLVIANTVGSYLRSKITKKEDYDVI